MRTLLPCLAVGAALIAAGCEREARETEPMSSPSGAEAVPVTTLEPGGKLPVVQSVKGKAFEANAFHLSEGKRLFNWFNCSGCHANGGGGMGPALMDDKWVYGGSIESIHATIRDGRPNGMPSFGRTIPDDQIWELSAYVRALSGQVSAAAAPSRNDDMMTHPAENRLSDPTKQPP